MELLVAVDDYCVTKIIIAASAAGVKIKVVKDVTHDDLKKLDIAAKSILLLTSSGIIAQHVSMLRYIAEIAPSAQLMGSTPFDSALVDQWLEFSWCELGALIARLISDREPGRLITYDYEIKQRYHYSCFKFCAPTFVNYLKLRNLFMRRRQLLT